MKLRQIKDPAEITAIRAGYFSFETPTNIRVMMHSIEVDGQVVGYVATEDFNTVGGIHIAVVEGYKNLAMKRKMVWIFENVYKPLMKELGKEFIVTTCDHEDDGTIGMIRACGFDIRKTVVAELKL